MLTATAAAQATEAGQPSDEETRRAAFVQSIRQALQQRLSLTPVGPSAEPGAEPGAEPTTDPQSGRQVPKPTAPTAPRSSATPLTLAEVLNQVERYHPKLRGAQLQVEIAAAKRLEKQGAFDPVVFAGTDYLRFNTEFDSKLSRGKLGTARIADVGVEFLTRSGMKVLAGSRFNLGKIKAPLSPTGDGGEYFLEFKMPLLRGWGINEKTAAERQAFLGEPLADAEFQTTRLELLLKTATAYWDWFAAQRKLAVARNLLDLSVFRADAVRERARLGDLPLVDVTEAELEVQRRQGAVVKADRDLQKAAFKLSLFLWEPNGLPAPIPTAAAAPATIPPPVLFSTDAAESGQRMALDRRPELRAVAINRDITQVDLALARNARRPGVDLAFSPGRDTGFGAIGNTFKGSLNFSLPLRQRTADGRIAAANLKLQKFDLDLANERQRVTNEVLDAVSAINTAYERFRAAEREVELARQLEEAERARFALGDSTLFLVNQRERGTAEARIKLIEVQAEYDQAVAAFRAATVQY